MPFIGVFYLNPLNSPSIDLLKYLCKTLKYYYVSDTNVMWDLGYRLDQEWPQTLTYSRGGVSGRWLDQLSVMSGGGTWSEEVVTGGDLEGCISLSGPSLLSCFLATMIAAFFCLDPSTMLFLCFSLQTMDRNLRPWSKINSSPLHCRCQVFCLKHKETKTTAEKKSHKVLSLLLSSAVFVWL